jgi:hypothetical protein
MIMRQQQQLKIQRLGEIAPSRRTTQQQQQSAGGQINNNVTYAGR